jgi:hypothetical protein
MRDSSSTPPPIEPKDGVSPFFSANKDLLIEVRTFLKETEADVATLQTDFLSEGARKDQRMLLFIAFILLFVALGMMSVAAGELKGPGDIKLSISGQTNILKIGIFVCLFYEVTYTIRCFTDWTAHSIKRSLAERGIEIARIETSRAVKPWAESREYLKLQLDMRFSKAAGDKPLDEEIARAKEIEHDRDMFTLVQKKIWFESNLARVRTSTFLRIAFEAFFPIVFGGFAIYRSYMAI